MHDDIPPKMLEWGSTLDQNIIDLFKTMKDMEETINSLVSVAKTPEERLLAVKFIYSVLADKLLLPIDAINVKTQNKILSQINLKINEALLKMKNVDSLEENHDN